VSITLSLSKGLCLTTLHYILTNDDITLGWYVKVRSLLSFILALLLIVGCASGPHFNTTSELASRDIKKVASLRVRGVNSRQLELRDGRRCVPGETEPFTGVAFSYWDNGREQSECNYKNGVAGHSINWNEHGGKSGEAHYIEPTDQRESIAWYDNGQIDHVWRYRDGKQDGPQEHWYKHGQKNYEWQWAEGKKHGPWIGWYENGQKDYQGNYASDKRDGVWSWWYENGQLSRQSTYVDGKPEGISIEWHENGVKSFEEHFENGKRVGQFLEWDWKGGNISDAIYKLRDNHMAVIEQAVEIRLGRYGKESLILQDPKDITKITSALTLEPMHRDASHGLFFSYAQFITKNGEVLYLSGNERQFIVTSEKRSARYLPVLGFPELLRSFTGQMNR
jgi:antitoxin component YwqK of YwqJK toxin-antitoxin module